MGYLETLRFNSGKKTLILLLGTFFSYLLLVVFITNHNLVYATIIGDFPLSYKFSLISSLFIGLYTAFSFLDFYLLIITAFLVGLNFTLFSLTVKNLRNSNVSFVVGGASILSIAAVGCTSCGLSVLSILGFSAALAFLPFDGLTIHFISLSLLLFSTFYMLKKLKTACKIK